MFVSLRELKVWNDEAFELDKATCFFVLSGCEYARCGRKTEEKYGEISSTHGKKQADL